MANKGFQRSFQVTNRKLHEDILFSIIEDRGRCGFSNMLENETSTIRVDNIDYILRAGKEPEADSGRPRQYDVELVQKGKEPKDIEPNLNVYAALSTLTGQYKWKIKGETWVYIPRKRDVFWPLVQLFGYAVAITMVLGAGYVTYKNMTDK